MTSSADMTATRDGSALAATPEEESVRADDIIEHSRNELNAWEKASFDAVHAILSVMVKIVGPAWVYRFGRWFGLLEWLINHKRRRRFAAALGEVMGELPPRPWLSRACLEFVQTSRCNKLFYLIFDSIRREQAQELIRMDRRDLVDAALGAGRGVYVAMSHLGPYQIGGMFMSLLGYKMAAVRDRNEGALSRYVQRRFDRKYPEFARMKVFFSDAYPRVIYRCLQEGYVLGSAMDVTRLRHENLRTETVQVFGRPREFLTGPLHIAIRCGVPVLQAFVLPEEDFRYRIAFYGPLYDPAAGKSEDDAVREAMATYAANIETHVRQHPSLITRV